MTREKQEAGRWLSAGGLAAATGLRSLMPAAMAAARLQEAEAPAGANLARRLISRPLVATGLRWAAALEAVGDKLPFIPARVTALPLSGRVAWGSLLAVAWTDARRPHAIAAAALLGGALAAGGAFAGHELRRRATAHRGWVAKLIGAAIEDAVTAVTSAGFLSRRLTR